MIDDGVLKRRARREGQEQPADHEEAHAGMVIGRR
jgi:hypothetical protein